MLKDIRIYARKNTAKIENFDLSFLDGEIYLKIEEKKILMSSVDPLNKFNTNLPGWLFSTDYLAIENQVDTYTMYYISPNQKIPQYNQDRYNFDRYEIIHKIEVKHFFFEDEENQQCYIERKQGRIASNPIFLIPKYLQNEINNIRKLVNTNIYINNYTYHDLKELAEKINQKAEEFKNLEKERNPMFSALQKWAEQFNFKATQYEKMPCLALNVDYSIGEDNYLKFLNILKQGSMDKLNNFFDYL